MKDQFSCVKCGQTVMAKETKCLQCGGWIRRAQRIRRVGFVVVALGFFLVALMGTTTIVLAPIMLSGGQETNGSRFTGSPAQAFLILCLFGIIILFGMVNIAGGIFQIATGRRSLLIIIFMFVLVFLLFVVGGAFARSGI